MIQPAAVFLDKDGTLIPDIPYNIDPEKITLSEGADYALQKLHDKGYVFVIISNQSGIARGLFSEEELLAVHQKLTSLFRSLNLSLEGFYYCPHHPEGTIEEYKINCDCRKPMPGLLFRAAQNLKLDLSRSWFIGDILNDVEAGNRAGCSTIMLNNGHETEWVEGEYRKPDFIVGSMKEAADVIIANSWHRKYTKV